VALAETACSIASLKLPEGDASVEVPIAAPERTDSIPSSLIFSNVLVHACAHEYVLSSTIFRLLIQEAVSMCTVFRQISFDFETAQLNPTSNLPIAPVVFAVLLAFVSGVLRIQDAHGIFSAADQQGSAAQQSNRMMFSVSMQPH